MEKEVLDQHYIQQISTFLTSLQHGRNQTMKKRTDERKLHEANKYVPLSSMRVRIKGLSWLAWTQKNFSGFSPFLCIAKLRGEEPKSEPNSVSVLPTHSFNADSPPAVIALGDAL